VEPQHPRVVGEALEFTAPDPAPIDRLVVAGGIRPGRGHDDEAKIEVEVFAECITVIDPMDVHVDSGYEHLEPLDPGLLGRFPQRHTGEFVVAVGVPTGLEPAPEFGVEEHQYQPTARIDHERRASEMAGHRRPIGERCAVLLEMCEHLVAHDVPLRIIERCLEESAPGPVGIPSRPELRILSGESAEVAHRDNPPWSRTV